MSERRRIEEGKECPTCGGIHWGSIYCPYDGDRSLAQPAASAPEPERLISASLVERVVTKNCDWKEIARVLSDGASAGSREEQPLKGEDAWLDELIECAGQRNPLRTVLRAFAANLRQQSWPTESPLAGLVAVAESYKTRIHKLTGIHQFPMEVEDWQRDYELATIKAALAAAGGTK